jgi:hypothetical protein
MDSLVVGEFTFLAEFCSGYATMIVILPLMEVSLFS